MGSNVRKKKKIRLKKKRANDLFVFWDNMVDWKRNHSVCRYKKLFLKGDYYCQTLMKTYLEI